MPLLPTTIKSAFSSSKLTADGNTYYGRSEDFGPRYVKHFGIEPAHKDGNEYTSVESGFEYKSKGATYRYTFVRDNPSQLKLERMKMLSLPGCRRTERLKSLVPVPTSSLT